MEDLSLPDKLTFECFTENASQRSRPFVWPKGAPLRRDDSSDLITVSHFTARRVVGAVLLGLLGLLTATLVVLVLKFGNKTI